MALLILALVAWNALAWPAVGSLGAASQTPAGTISVLIPARDEERNIADCLDALLGQGEALKEILVYDDNSVDATAEIVRGYAERDGRVRLLKATENLPPGWCGKNFACAQLAQEARGPWLLFLDADVRLCGEDAAARILAEARARRLTLLSCWPGQTAVGFWEKTLMPMLNFVVLTLFPAPLSLERMDQSLGLAHGACLLIGRESYAAFGGHAMVRDEIFEDTVLARKWRASGRRGLCLDGRALVRVRMYGSFAEIWKGFQKNFFPGFRRESNFWTFLSFHLAVFLAPFVLFPFALKDAAVSRVLLITAACVLLMRLLLAVRFRQSLWSILLHPLSETILVALGLSSWWRCKSGRGVQWKGRSYRARDEPESEVAGESI